MNLPHPLPANELQRLQVVKQLKILDTPPEPQFDALVRTAARLFNVPISAFTLVDDHRIWFKARISLDRRELPRAGTFCSHAVASGRMLVVEDATRDERFAKNSLVQMDRGIRFYAGAPITLGDGHDLGTLCILDTKPRAFSDAERIALADLAEVANSHISRQAKHMLADDLARATEIQTELLRRQNNELQAQKRILDQAARFAKLGGFEVDLDSGELHWTEGMYAIHGIQPTAPLSYGDHYSMYAEPHRSTVKAAVAHARARGGTFDVEAPATTPDGKKRWFRIAGGYVHQEGQPPRWCGMKQDITSQKRMQKRIAFLAEHDPVTRLANRAKLQSVLDQSFNANQSSIGLILVDVDNFKRINDTHGHPVGDACLRALTGRIRRATRGRSLVARTGGDEFAIVPEIPTSLPTLVQISERLLTSLRKPIECEGLSFNINVSIGIACGTAASTAEIMRQADVALYESKAAGRETWRAFTPEMDAAAQDKYRQISTIAWAIKANQIDVFYQPKRQLATLEHTGFEALVRWRRDDGQVMSPASFVAALEDPIVSARLGEVVLDKVIDQAEVWRRKGVPTGHIAVNLAPSQLADPDIVKRIIARLDRHGLPRTVLEVEITENVFLAKDSDEMARVLKEFRSNGIKVSLDDFGTGFASLTHLRQFRVDALKIDRSFVSRLGRAAEDTLIVQGIVGLAHSLGIDVVAEGIETEAQLEFLRALRCEYGQGYLFARPEPAAVWEANMMANVSASVV